MTAATAASMFDSNMEKAMDSEVTDNTMRTALEEKETGSVYTFFDILGKGKGKKKVRFGGEDSVLRPAAKAAASGASVIFSPESKSEDSDYSPETKEAGIVSESVTGIGFKADGASENKEIDGEIDPVLEAEMDYIRRSTFDHPLALLPLPVGKPASTLFVVPPGSRQGTHSGITGFLAAQLETDALNPDSAPLAMYDGDILPGNRRVKLGRRISGTKFVLVNEIVDHTDSVDGIAVIKYQSSCESPNSPFNVILRDYWFQRILAGTNICPKVYFVSPPAKFPKFKTPKLNFRLDETEWTKCANHPRSHIRYMVMEKIPTTVWGLLNQRGAALEERFRLGLQLIDDLIPKLKRMHTELGIGIVHADLHPGNIVQLRDDSFGLLDFGLAFFRDEYGPRDRARERSPKGFAHCFYSHYNIMGYRFGPRDDVFKALLSAAFLMTNSELYGECMKFQTNPNGMYLFHRNGNFFNFKNTLISQAGVAGENGEIEQAIVKHLEMTLVLARSVNGVDDLPNYDEITRHASAVRSIIDYVGGGIPVPPELLMVPEIELPIVTSVRLDRAERVFSAFSKSTNTPKCPALTAAASLKFPHRMEDRIVFAEGRLTSTTGGFSRTALSDFEHRLMNLLESEGVVERLSPAEGLTDDCSGRLVFRTTADGINKRHMSDMNIGAIFASSIIGLLKTVHSLGLVLGSQLAVYDMTFDLETNKKLLLMRIPRSVRMFVDPWTGRHAAECASWETSDECPTRKTDLQTVAQILTQLLPDYFVETTNAFAAYAGTLNAVDEPEYDYWRSEFRVVGVPAIISTNIGKMT